MVFFNIRVARAGFVAKKSQRGGGGQQVFLILAGAVRG